MDVHLRVKSRNVFSIMIDGDAWRDIHVAVFGRRPKLPDCSRGDEPFKEDFCALEKSLAKHYVLRRLAQRSYSSWQLRKLLEERMVLEETAEALLREMEELGYLNDGEWIDAFIRSQKGKKVGPARIRMKLRAKGVPEDTLEGCALEETDEVVLEQIVALLATRYRKADLCDFKQRQKVIASLARRGYSFSLIQQALRAAT